MEGMNKLNVGKLNKRVSFAKRDGYIKVDGIDKPNYAHVFSAWANVYPVKWREYFQAAAEINELIVNVTVRKLKGLTTKITADWRVEIEKEDYEIIAPPVERNKGYIEILCKVVK